jgi:hypothetical protein
VLILPATPTSVEDWRPTDKQDVPQPVEDIRRNIYPIW